MEKKHEMWELNQLQSLPLNAKIQKTKDNIQNWVNAFGKEAVYVSFSGGKDSTVLLDIAREIYPQIPAIFVDTGLEFPQIRNFVKMFDNVEILKPQMNFEQVIRKYGYPFISKEVSECVYGAKKYLTSIIESGILDQTDRQTDSLSNDFILKQSTQNNIICINTKFPTYLEQCNSAALSKISPGGYDNKWRKINGLGEYLNKKMVNREGGANQRLAILTGMLTKDKNHPVAENVPRKDRSIFSMEHYQFLLDAPFYISNKCCDVMKKYPAHMYNRTKKRVPITGQMACESRLRTQKWLQNGCNAFDAKNPISNPMAFWTEQDVLLYIYLYGKDMVNRRISHIEIENGCDIEEVINPITNTNYEREDFTPICSVYGNVVKDFHKEGQVEQQISLSDYGIFDNERPLLKTTGCSRTGCTFCGFGCHIKKDDRFMLLRNTNPKVYDYVMRGGTFNKAGCWEPKQGLGYWFVIEWLKVHGNLNIIAPEIENYVERYSTKDTKKYLRGENI